MKNLLSVSVTGYPQKDVKLFDYYDSEDQKSTVGSIVEVPFGPKIHLGVVMHVTTAQAVDKSILAISQRLELPILPTHYLQLAEWLMRYYAASPSAVWRTMLATGLRQKLRLKPREDNENPEPPTLQLSSDQQTVVDSIIKSDRRGHLLHGITGSGKTEVYIRLVQHALEQNQSCFLLVPEIALTPQMVDRLKRYFGNQLVVSHSQLTPARRKQIWLEANMSKPKVYIGPRSILFLPVKELGLIIIDEEHETSYKQDNAPTYTASTVAAELSKLTNAKFILGSATPSVYAAHAAQQGRLELHELRERALGAQLPKVEIVQLKPGVLLSPQLVNEIKHTLSIGKQTILFLNRRGSASALLCESCGSISLCPRCDTSLTFHADTARLICHYCNYSTLPPTQCQNCQATTLRFIGSGTKRVEQTIAELFPSTNICRIDGDNNKLEVLEDAYKKLASGETNILIGTQMIARGLDLPNVTTVGVVLAENMLAIPDFSSSERTFDLLTQVAGRAGRSSFRGKVIIQTHSPTHPVILAAAQHDYKLFFSNELEHRKKHIYPPYAYLLKLTYRHRKLEKALEVAKAEAEQIVTDYQGVVVLGPATEGIRRHAGMYEQQLVVKSLKRSTLVEITTNTKAGWRHDLDPINLL